MADIDPIQAVAVITVAGEIAKAVAHSPVLCKLLDTTRAGCGVIYLPIRIVLEALARKKAASIDKETDKIKAEARKEVAEIDKETDKIKAEGRAEESLIDAVTEVAAMDHKDRGQAQIAARAKRRDRNRQAIVDKTVQELPESVSEEPVDEDWAIYFFESCQDIGNDDMQQLWAKILAGEITRPGSFSLKTLETVKTLRKQDALLFTAFCSHIWRSPFPRAIVTDPGHPELGITIEGLIHLASLGFITFEAVPGASFLVSYPAMNPQPPLVFVYYKRVFQFTLPQGRSNLDVGPVMLTSVGQELFPIAGGEPNDKYLNLTLERFRSRGINVQEVPQAT